MAMVTGVVGGVAAVLSAVAASEPDPDVADRMPGLGAFIVFVFLAAALYFLLKNMNARLRRMSYREREREEREAAAEQAPSDDLAPSQSQEPQTRSGGEGTDLANPDLDEPESGERG